MASKVSEQVQEPDTTQDEPGELDERETVEPLEGEDEHHGEGGESFEDEDEHERPQIAVGNMLTPEALEKRTRSAETRFKTYAAGISKLYGDDALSLTPCPLCPDHHKGFVDVNFAGRVPAEIQDAVRMFFGLAREQDYAQSRIHRTCGQCDGKGKVATGSRVPEYQHAPCPDCQGRGFVGPQETAQTNGHVVTGPTVLGTDLPSTQAFDDADEWGEPRILPDGRDNPNFGKMPNRKILVEPWGVTAHLNAFSEA